MPSLTVENYLKAILQIELQTDATWISGGQLAQALGVSPGTVTSMQKTLDEAELAEYRPYEGVCLTQAGRRLAVRMLRRHRLIEQFLVETLGLTWDQVHEEAEHMEHAVSDMLIDRIDEFLGCPRFDPHGDPIPTADGELPDHTSGAVPLSACGSDEQVRVVRVINQGRDFLRFLTQHGVALGVVGRVAENSNEAGMVRLELDSGSVALGQQAARQVLVELVQA